MGYTYYTNKFGEQKLVCSRQAQVFKATHKSYTLEVTKVTGGFEEFIVELTRKYYGKNVVIESIICQTEGGAIALAKIYQNKYFKS